MDARFASSLVIEQCAGLGHDRAVVVQHPEALVVAVADGSGGQAGGGEAAQAVIDAVERRLAEGLVPLDKAAWCALLVDLDRIIEEDPQAGEATAVVLAVGRRFIVGACVGDSRAVLLGRASVLDLTERQNRRPLLGTGGALPVPIMAPSKVGTLVVGTDGLFAYVQPKELQRLASGRGSLDERARALLEAVRLPSGGLSDDVALCLVDTV
jgi:PPM family protein phosphatase